TSLTLSSRSSSRRSLTSSCSAPSVHLSPCRRCRLVLCAHSSRSARYTRLTRMLTKMTSSTSFVRAWACLH
ncbi:hypothetical protein GGH18_002032, partial [Coemansia sp. RSA 530]